MFVRSRKRITSSFVSRPVVKQGCKRQLIEKVISFSIIRIFQGIRYIIPYINKNYENEAVKVLTDKEKEFYFEMTQYDRSHSLAVYRDVLKLDMDKSKKGLLMKAALLHDIGKGSKVNFLDRVLYVVFRKNEILANHPENGYDKLRKINSLAADIVREHHNKNSDNELVKLFISIDNKN